MAIYKGYDPPCVVEKKYLWKIHWVVAMKILNMRVRFPIIPLKSFIQGQYNHCDQMQRFRDDVLSKIEKFILVLCKDFYGTDGSTWSKSVTDERPFYNPRVDTKIETSMLSIAFNSTKFNTWKNTCNDKFYTKMKINELYTGWPFSNRTVWNLK